MDVCFDDCNVTEIEILKCLKTIWTHYKNLNNAAEISSNLIKQLQHELLQSKTNRHSSPLKEINNDLIFCNTPTTKRRKTESPGKLITPLTANVIAVSQSDTPNDSADKFNNALTDSVIVDDDSFIITGRELQDHNLVKSCKNRSDPTCLMDNLFDDDETFCATLDGKKSRPTSFDSPTVKQANQSNSLNKSFESIIKENVKPVWKSKEIIKIEKKTPLKKLLNISVIGPKSERKCNGQKSSTPKLSLQSRNRKFRQAKLSFDSSLKVDAKVINGSKNEDYSERSPTIISKPNGQQRLLLSKDLNDDNCVFKQPTSKTLPTIKTLDQTTDYSDIAIVPNKSEETILIKDSQSMNMLLTPPSPYISDKVVVDDISFEVEKNDVKPNEIGRPCIDQPICESPIRKRSEKLRRPGFDCADCETWHKFIGHNLTDKQMGERINKCSKHRRYIRGHETPEGFWWPMFPPTQENPK